MPTTPPLVRFSADERLERCSRLHAADGPPALWTGTRDGILATGIAVVAALLFGGAAGGWFDLAEGLARWAVIAAGTAVMGAMVAAVGTLMVGRNAIFWGMGMPLVVYVAGAFCAVISGHGGAFTLVGGAPAFCGLAIVGGLLAAWGSGRVGMAADESAGNAG